MFSIFKLLIDGASSKAQDSYCPQTNFINVHFEQLTSEINGGKQGNAQMNGHLPAR